MTTPGPILIATDLSARSDRALERALLLGAQLGRPVIVLHVIHSASRIECDEEQRLRTILQDEFDLAERDVDVRFAYGSPPSVIAQVAADEGCSLIVTGVARYNSPRDFVLGTAIDYLIRKSKIPVLVVKRRARRDYQRLVVATDFSPSAEVALHKAAELFPDLQLLLLHAYEPAFEAFLSHETTAPLVREEADEALSQLIERLPASLQSRLDRVNEEGGVAAVLSRHVSDAGTDLLVLGAESRSGHSHFLTSHDLWKLPSSEPCDVLVIRRQE